MSGWGQGGGTYGSYYGTGGGGGGGYKGGAGGVYWQSGGGGSSYIDSAYTPITSTATPGSGGLAEHLMVLKVAQVQRVKLSLLSEVS